MLMSNHLVSGSVRHKYFDLFDHMVSVYLQSVSVLCGYQSFFFCVISSKHIRYTNSCDLKTHTIDNVLCSRFNYCLPACTIHLINQVDI